MPTRACTYMLAAINPVAQLQLSTDHAWASRMALVAVDCLLSRTPLLQIDSLFCTWHQRHTMWQAIALTIKGPMIFLIGCGQ